VNGQLLDNIHVLAAAVIALAGIAFGVFVGQLRTLRFHHGRAGVVFRSDQLDMLFLALVFLLDGSPQLRVIVGKAAVRVEHEDSSYTEVEGQPVCSVPTGQPPSNSIPGPETDTEWTDCLTAAQANGRPASGCRIRWPLKPC